MEHRRRAGLCATVLSLALLTASTGVVSSAAPPPLDVVAALEAYSTGGFDKALASVRRVPSDRLADLGMPVVQAARLFVERTPEDRGRRALAAAAFVLESQLIRAERGGWTTTEGDLPCTGACVLEWACGILQSRGAPDPVERTWMLASVALAGGVRDWVFLHSPLSPPGPRTQIRGHVLHALERFPDESRFRLARAEAIASRLAVLPEMQAPREGEITGPAPTMDVLARNNAMPFITDLRASQTEYAKKHLSDLIDDPAVGPEARMRLAYLDFRSGAYGTAMNQALKAADAATDADVRYVALYLGAQAAQALGNLAGAEAFLRSALDVRPHSQSAAIGLAALTYRRGEAEPAYALIDSTFRERAGDDDPWRMFLYGDFTRLPGLIGELRQQIGGAK